MSDNVVVVKLEEFGGQKADVELIRSTSGEWSVMFKSKEGFGYPCLDMDRLKFLMTLTREIEIEIQRHPELIRRR